MTEEGKAAVRVFRPLGASEFWEREVEFRRKLSVNGEFWSDAVARLKREKSYFEAASICRYQLPLPAAYEDLSKCLRKLYSNAEDPQAVLQEQYIYALEAEALCRVPYVTYQTPTGQSGAPGFNVTQIVWEWLRSSPLSMNYSEVGYQHVGWLSPTDRKRLVSHFGEPKGHQDPFELIRSHWERGVAEFARQEASQASGLSALKAEIADSARPSSGVFSKWVFGRH